MSRKFDFDIDLDKLGEVCSRAHAIWEERIRMYLPQWNLPRDLESDPIGEVPRDPEAAARLLWVEAFLERRTKSSAIIGNVLKTWGSAKQNWIFNPFEVARKSVSDVGEVIREGLKFGLQAPGEKTPEERFYANAQPLVKDYGGDSRKLVEGRTVEDARNQLMRFQGIGSGIANLLIVYFMDRGVASPTDPQNALLKVDVHKGRIPIQCGAVIPRNGRIPRDEYLESCLSNAYFEASQAEGLNAVRLDSGLWVVGSEMCSKRDYEFCGNNCPLFDMCQGYVPEDRETGQFVVYDDSGERVDGRRHKHQRMLGFGSIGSDGSGVR